MSSGSSNSMPTPASPRATPIGEVEQQAREAGAGGDPDGENRQQGDRGAHQHEAVELVEVEGQGHLTSVRGRPVRRSYRSAHCPRTGTCSSLGAMAELTGTAAPAVLPAADLGPEAEAWDVVVVGFGIAGGCAALEAARAGARVLLLERAAVHGGTSSMSGGHFYLGGGTAVQRATGHDDSADAMFDYLVAVSLEPGAREDPGLLRRVGRALRLAGGAGVRVRALLLPRQGGHPARHRGPDVHRQREGLAVRRPGDAGAARAQGAGRRATPRAPSWCMDLLRSRVEEAGVEVRYETGATNLVADESGAVVGAGLAAVPGDRAGPRRLGRAGGGRLRDERGHGRRAHAGARVEAVHPRVDVRRRARASASASRWARSSSTWSSRSSPPRSTRPRRWSRA